MYQLKEKLSDLKENHRLVALKADLESDIVSFDEIRFLRKIAKEINLNFVLKTSGCGAIGDVSIAKDVCAEVLVAPMIESKYALEKFVNTCETVYKGVPLPKLHINIETISGVKNFDKIVEGYVDKFSAVVFGRSDFTSSIKSDCADSDEVFDYINNVKLKTFDMNKDFIIGGSLTKESVGFIEKLKPSYVETRNLVFEPFITEETVKKYIDFEIHWLTSKTSQNQMDINRIEVLKNRLK